MVPVRGVNRYRRRRRHRPHSSDRRRHQPRHHRQALLFADEKEPYHGSGSRWFHTIGYGAGTDPGGSSDCADGTTYGKRLGVNFYVDVSDDSNQAYAPYGATHPCPGDSGSPWLFARRERVFLTIDTAR